MCRGTGERWEGVSGAKELFLHHRPMPSPPAFPRHSLGKLPLNLEDPFLPPHPPASPPRLGPGLNLVSSRLAPSSQILPPGHPTTQPPSTLHLGRRGGGQGLKLLFPFSLRGLPDHLSADNLILEFLFDLVILFCFVLFLCARGGRKYKEV